MELSSAFSLGKLLAQNEPSRVARWVAGDAAIVHVSVRVDAGGAVIAPPEVSGIYTDCL